MCHHRILNGGPGSLPSKGIFRVKFVKEVLQMMNDAHLKKEFEIPHPFSLHILLDATH